MKKFFKWTGITFGSIIVLLIIVISAIILTMNHRLSKSYTLNTRSFNIPDDSSSLARGKRLSAIHCAGCHGENFQCITILKDDAIGMINSANLTKGKGSVTLNYSDDDWIKAIRHGIDPNGRPLLVMPSKEFYYLSDNDLGSIIAYMKTVMPIDNEISKYQITMLTKVLITMGAFGKVISAEEIDHYAPRPVSPLEGVTLSYGHYMATTSGCFVCHGQNLTGGKDPNPQAPPAPDITKSGNFGKWSEEDFISVIRTGRTPEGKQLSIFMPWKDFGKMTDMELKALYKFLKSA